MVKIMLNLILEQRWLSALALGSISAASVIGLTRLEFDDNLDTIFRASSEDRVLMDELCTQLDLEKQEFLIVVEAEDLIRDEVVSILWDLQFDCLEVEGVDRVWSILQARNADSALIIPPPGSDEASFSRARAELLSHPLIAQTSITRDGRATILVVEVADKLSAVPDLQPVYQALVEAMQQASQSGVVKMAITGIPAMRCELVRIQQRELPMILLAGVLTGTVAAWLLFRCWAAMAVAFPVPLIAAFWTLGLMGLFGRTFDLMAIIIPPLAMTIAITDAVHLLCAIRDGIERGEPPMEAARNGLKLVGPACFLASLTSMIAFTSLSLSQSPMLAQFGLTCAGATLAVFVSTIIWVPLVASTGLGRRIARKRRLRSVSVSGVLTTSLGARPAGVVCGGVLILATAVLFSSQLRPNYRFSENLPAMSTVVEAFHRVDSLLGGAARFHVMVEWPENLEAHDPQVTEVLKEIEQLLTREEPIGRPFSLATLNDYLVEEGDGPDSLGDLLESAPPNLIGRLVNPEVRRTVVSVPVADVGSRILEPMFSRIEGNLAEVRQSSPGFEIRVTGTVFHHSAMSGEMISDLATGLGTAAVGIFLVVGLALRSADLAVRSILPNVLPLAGVAAILAVTTGSLRYISVLALTIGLGTVIDDTVQFLYRYRHEMKRSGNDREKAVRQTIHAVGSALVTTTLVLAAGLGALLFSSLPAARLFAMMITAVLVFALLSDLVILPALLFWPRRKNTLT